MTPVEPTDKGEPDASTRARPTGYIRIRTPDDPDGWTAEGDVVAGHPYIYSSGDVAVELTWDPTDKGEPDGL